MSGEAASGRGEPTRVLIVRLGALGDIVHAIPVAAALRRAYPSARIDWLVSSKHREMLDLVSVVDHRIVVNDRRTGGGGSIWSTVRALRRTRYDVAIDLQGLIKSAALARLSGARTVVGFSRRYLREPAAGLFYTRSHDPGGPGMHAPAETRHIVDINLGVLGALGIAPGPPEFPLVAVESPVRHEMAERTGGRYALVNPGAAWPNKRWAPARFAEVAARLRERHGLASVVLWGPGEEELADAIVAGAGGAAIRSPRTTIADIVALARGATVMLSGDTGPTHIGGAVGVPIVGIFGPTRPERNGPWRRGDQTVSRASVCQCHHKRQCRLPVMCLLDIGVEEVVAAVERCLVEAGQAWRMEGARG